MCVICDTVEHCGTHSGILKNSCYRKGGRESITKTFFSLGLVNLEICKSPLIVHTSHQ